jgi:hypothetical protein
MFDDNPDRPLKIDFGGMKASSSIGTDFLLEAGGAVAGGGALGGFAGFLGWSLSHYVLSAYSWIRRRPLDVELGFAELTAFSTVGGLVGAVVGFLTWIYEHFELI